MKYRITITRTDINENFAAEMAKFEERYPWARGRRTDDPDHLMFRPQREGITDALICELTEDQFKKIKAECFKAFE